jgi:hypothetical protein
MTCNMLLYNLNLPLGSIKVHVVSLFFVFLSNGLMMAYIRGRSNSPSKIRLQATAVCDYINYYVLTYICD